MTHPDAPDYVADALRDVLADADRRAIDTAQWLTNLRQQVEQAEATHAEALARRDALAHELRLRQASHPDNVALRAAQADD